jgi:hypothetical protein
MEDMTLIWQIFLTVVLFPNAYFVNRALNKLKEVDNKINKCHVNLPKNYIAKNEFNIALHRIETQLDQIYNLLQHKKDK